MAEHGFNKLSYRVARFCPVFDGAVVACAGYAEHTALLIHKRIHFIGSEIVRFHYCCDNRRVNRAAAGAHDDAFKRGETHCGVQALAVLDGCD